MKKDKVTILKSSKEKKVASAAKESYEKFLEKNYTQNPIKAKFLAFQKAKKAIKSDDLI